MEPCTTPCSNGPALHLVDETTQDVLQQPNPSNFKDPTSWLMWRWQNDYIGMYLRYRSRSVVLEFLGGKRTTLQDRRGVLWRRVLLSRLLHLVFLEMIAFHNPKTIATAFAQAHKIGQSNVTGKVQIEGHAFDSFVGNVLRFAQCFGNGDLDRLWNKPAHPLCKGEDVVA